MADFSDLARNINRLADRVERRGPEIQRKVALAVLRNVVLGTPVGNKQIWNEPGKARVGYVGGRARANWFVGLATKPGGTTEETDASGAGTVQNGQTVISTTPPHTDIHIANNLPYIVPLNQGHSHQAPEGWIDTAVQAASALLAKEKVTEEGSST